MMKVLFVINNFYLRGNGLCSSARRTVTYLREAGVDVRVLSGSNPDSDGPQPEYSLHDYNLPVFDGLVQAQGYQFAAPDMDVIRQAVAWADVVHLEEPFPLEYRAGHLARKMGKAVTATYHLHPENLLASVHIDRFGTLTRTMMRLIRDLVYSSCSDIQCPTMNVMDRLDRFKFKQRMHLISNGLVLGPEREVVGRDLPASEPFTVINIGRLSVEKDQETLLKAMRFTRHARDIRLVFAGKGPMEENYRKMGEKLVADGILAREPEFLFLDEAGLRSLVRSAGLFVHCAYIEVEGLSCLEALQEGIVPVIADGPLTATAQFALDRMSIFPVKSPRALARRIDWWMEHPERRKALEPAYAALARDYDIRKSIRQLISMFETALADPRPQAD